MPHPDPLLQTALKYHEAGQWGDAEAAYHKILAIDAGHSEIYRLLGGLYLQTGRLLLSVDYLTQYVTLYPNHVETLTNLGLALLASGQNDAASENFQKALHIEPGNLTSLIQYGNILRNLGMLTDAAGCYRRALQHRPDFAPAATNLALCLRDMGRIDEGLEMARNALRVMPDSADMLVNLGALLQESAKHREAVESFNQALRLKPTVLTAKWNKAFSLLALGEYKEGWELYEDGIGILSMRGAHPFTERRWNGEDIKGERLLIWCEQGLGDDLQMIRYAELCKAKGCTILVQCPQTLRRLFSNCPFIDVLPEAVDEKDFDFHIPMMSLPYIFGTTLGSIPVNIPYLRVSEKARTQWADKFIGKKTFKVGLVWAGKSHKTHLASHWRDQRRSMAFEMLLTLFDIKNIHFYNLQSGASGVDKRLIDLMPEVVDFEDTAAIIENLDLVISVDTSVAHLAGALGKPVWVMSRYDADWRWLQNQTANPWYPTAKIFGQQSPGDWSGVVERVKSEITKMSLTQDCP